MTVSIVTDGEQAIKMPQKSEDILKFKHYLKQL